MVLDGGADSFAAGGTCSPGTRGVPCPSDGLFQSTDDPLHQVDPIPHRSVGGPAENSSSFDARRALLGECDQSAASLALRRAARARSREAAGAHLTRPFTPAQAACSATAVTEPGAADCSVCDEQWQVAVRSQRAACSEGSTGRGSVERSAFGFLVLKHGFQRWSQGGDASRPVQGHLHSQSTKQLVAAAQLLVLGWLTLVSYSECFEKQWAWDAGREGSCPSQCSRCAWASGDVLPVVGAARI